MIYERFIQAVELVAGKKAETFPQGRTQAVEFCALVQGVGSGYALLSTDNKAAGAKLTPNRIETAINYVDSSNVDLYLAANKIYVQK